MIFNVSKEEDDWNPTWLLFAAGPFMHGTESRLDPRGQVASLGCRRKMMVYECEEDMVPCL